MVWYRDRSLKCCWCSLEKICSSGRQHEAMRFLKSLVLDQIESSIVQSHNSERKKKKLAKEHLGEKTSSKICFTHWSEIWGWKKTSKAFCKVWRKHRGHEASGEQIRRKNLQNTWCLCSMTVLKAQFVHHGSGHNPKLVNPKCCKPKTHGIFDSLPALKSNHFLTQSIWKWAKRCSKTQSWLLCSYIPKELDRGREHTGDPSILSERCGCESKFLHLNSHKCSSMVRHGRAGSWSTLSSLRRWFNASQFHFSAWESRNSGVYRSAGEREGQRKSITGKMSRVCRNGLGTETSDSIRTQRCVKSILIKTGKKGP